MSEQQAAPEAIELPPSGDAAFASLMDALVPDATGEAGGEAGGKAGSGTATGAQPGGGDAGGTGGAPGQPGGQPAPAEPAAAGTPPPAGEQPAGDQQPPAGTPEQPAADGGATDLPEAWTADASDLAPRIGQLTTKLEEAATEAFKTEALDAVRDEHTPYFEALEKHPRLLVGQDVPSLTGEGTERLGSTQEAKDWQEAVQSILVAEVEDRAGRAMDENKEYLTTLHSSVELFQNNTDLIPGTKQFDRQLADRFVEIAEPYAVRVEGKLHGYSVPVQPLVNALRAAVAAERATKPPAAATASPGPAAAGSSASGVGGSAPSPTPDSGHDAPQAGISSKAGHGSSSEDFSTLFGTIGLPDLQI